MGLAQALLGSQGKLKFSGGTPGIIAGDGPWTRSTGSGLGAVLAGSQHKARDVSTPNVGGDTSAPSTTDSGPGVQDAVASSEGTDSKGGGWFSKAENRAKLASALAAASAAFGSPAASAAQSAADRLRQQVSDEKEAAKLAEQRAGLGAALSQMGISFPGMEHLDPKALQGLLVKGATRSLPGLGGGRGGSGGGSKPVTGFAAALKAAQASAFDPGGDGGATVTEAERANIAAAAEQVRWYNELTGAGQTAKPGDLGRFNSDLENMDGLTPEQREAAALIKLGLKPRAVERDNKNVSNGSNNLFGEPTTPTGTTTTGRGLKELGDDFEILNP